MRFAPPYLPVTDGLRLRVRVAPGSRARTIESDGDDLVVRVRSRAVEGAATTEACALVAAAFGLRPSAVRCLRGATSRHKTLAVTGDPEALARRADELRDVGYAG